MEAVDIAFFNSLQYVLENDPEPLDLTFSVLEESFGEASAIIYIYVTLLVWPREVEPLFHSCYRGRVETLDTNIKGALFELLVWPHEVERFHSWYRGRVETLDAKYNLIFR